MKIECKTKFLRSAFDVVSSVVPSKTPKPVVQNVKLQADKTGVTLLGTDTEIAIRQGVIEAIVTTPGEVLLPKDRLSAILREIDADTVTLELKDSQDAKKTKLVIKSGRGNWDLPTQDTAEFPECADFIAKDYWSAPSEIIRRRIKLAVLAISQRQEKNPAMSGVCLNIMDTNAEFAGTDTRRLHISEFKVEKTGKPEIPIVTIEGKTGPMSVIMSAKLVGLVERCLPDESPVDIAFDQNSIFFRSVNTVIAGRLSEGRYPKYRAKVREVEPIGVDIPMNSFHQTVRRSMTIISDESQSVLFHFEKGKLSLHAQSSGGEFNEELPLAYEGETVSIRLIPSFISDFIRSIDSALVLRCEMENAEVHMMLSDSSGNKCIIMPVVIEESKPDPKKEK